MAQKENDEKLMEEAEKTIKEFEEKNKNQLSEGFFSWYLNNLSWSGKLIAAGIASYLGGVAMEKLAGKKAQPPKLPFKIKGTPEQIQAITDAIVTSAAFTRELNKPGASVQSVIDKLNLKNMTADKFKALTGHRWPLT